MNIRVELKVLRHFVNCQEIAWRRNEFVELFIDGAGDSKRLSRLVFDRFRHRSCFLSNSFALSRKSPRLFLLLLVLDLVSLGTYSFFIDNIKLTNFREKVFCMTGEDTVITHMRSISYSTDITRDNLCLRLIK